MATGDGHKGGSTFLRNASVRTRQLPRRISELRGLTVTRSTGCARSVADIRSLFPVR
jgi:hypothetical protein